MPSPVDHLSYSSIQTYMTCPRSWYFKYIKKLPTATSEAAFFGKMFHSAVEAYLVTDRSVPPATFMPLAWEQNKDTVANLDGKTPEEVVNDGVRLLSDKAIIDTLNTVVPWVFNGQPMIELYIEWKLDGVPVPVIGYVDCIGDDGVPYDFKTSARSWGSEKAALEVQPAIYLAALAQMGMMDQWEFRHLVFVRTKTPKIELFETTRTPQDLEFAADVVRRVWHGIDAGCYPPNPFGWKCGPGMCEFWSECRG